MDKGEIFTLPGLIEDLRTQQQKANDYQFPELYGAPVVLWREKLPTEWKQHSLRDQNGSGTCVAQGCVKAIETESGIIASAHPIYARRSNAPYMGMYLQEGGSLLKNFGTTTDILDPSQRKSEEEMNKPVTVDTPLKVSGYGFCSVNIDQIAAAIDLHKGVALTFGSNYLEWTDVPKVYGEVAWGHCVCAVDYFMYEGEKALLIEDSWGKATSLGNGGQRIIKESFLRVRGTGAMFLLPAKNDPVKKPAYVFSFPLTYGITMKDVVALQDMLKYEGFFPIGTLSTGYFGNVTANSLKKWQVAHGIMDFANEKNLKNIRFGGKSIALANKLYPII